MPKKVNTVGLEMPDDFAVDAYNDAHAILCSKQRPREIYLECGRAWNAIAYRYMACLDHDAAFTRSILQDGIAPLPPARHVQEREIFNFFMSGLAAIESFYYGIYAVAAMMMPVAFPLSTFKERRNVTPKLTTERFEGHFPGDSMTLAMRQTLNDAGYQQWDGVRNVLDHRICLGRAVSVTVGRTSSQSAAWQDIDLKAGPEDINLDQTTTAWRREWLTRTISKLVSEAAGFVARNASRLATV